MRMLLLLGLCGCATGAFQVTPQCRIFVDAYAAAARALGYGRKQIAHTQQLTEAQWRRQFEAEEGQHVSLYRLALSPPDLVREWIYRIAPAFGLRVFHRTDDIVRLIDIVKASHPELVTSHSTEERRSA